MNSKKVSDCCNATVIETFVEDKRPLCSICYKPCSVHEEVEGEGWEWEKHLLTEFEKKEGVKLFDLLHKAVCLHDEHSSSRPYIEEVLSKFLNFLRPAIKSLLLEERKRAVREFIKKRNTKFDNFALSYEDAERIILNEFGIEAGKEE